VGPRTGQRDIEVVTTGLGFESVVGFDVDVLGHVAACDPVAEGGRLPLEGSLLVGRLKRVGPPLPVDEHVHRC